MTNSNLYLPARLPVPARAWNALQRERWPFLITVLVILGAAGILIRRLPTIYQSTATVLIEYPRSTEELSSLKEANIGKLDAVGEKANPINNQMALLSSRPLYEKALEQLNLSKSEAPYSGLSVNAKSSADLIQVSYQSESPELAARVAQAVVETYMIQNLATNQAKGSTAEAFIEKRLPQLQNRLQTARNRLKQFQQEHQFLGTSVETDSLMSMQNKLTEDVNNAQAELVATSEKIDRLKTQLPNDITASVNAAGMSQDPGYQDLQKKLLEVKGQIAQLQSRFTPEHPQLREALEERNRLESLLQSRSGSLLGQQVSTKQPVDPLRGRLIEDWVRLEAERSAQAARFNQLGQQLQLAKSRTGQLPQLIKQQAELEMAKETAQQDYLAFRDKYTASQVAGQQGISNVRLIEPASEATTQPIAPNSKLLLALAIVTSTATGLAVVWFRRQGDDDIDSAFVLREMLPIPILASIPWSGNGILAPQEETNNGELANSYRLLQAHIRMLPKHHQVLAVSSWTAGEGRSSVAANLALMEAQAGQRVLLINVGSSLQSVGSPWQSDAENLDSTRLEDPQSKGPWHANLQSILPNYDRLASTNSPTTTLYKQWLTLLERARERYDLIILDCPSTQEGPDATLLAAMADGVLWVVCPEQLGRRNVEMAAETLSTWSTRLLGQVVIGSEASFSPELLTSDRPQLIGSGREWQPELQQ